MKSGIASNEHGVVQITDHEVSIAFGLIRIPIAGPGHLTADVDEISVSNFDVPVKRVTITGVKIIKLGDHLHIFSKEQATCS